MTMSLYLCDIDGTIADNKHREWVLKESRPKPNWDLFFNLAAQDKPVEHMLDLLFNLQRSNNEIVYVTGRPERLRMLTVNWLRQYGFPNGRMYMRADGDHRPDELVKRDMLKAICADGYDKPSLVFDDRNKVVAMWREHGIPCLQVAEGDF